MPRIALTSVFVDDQAKAERFYTEILGFQVKHDIPCGEYRWLTVVSAEAPEGTELLLEPDAHPASKVYCAALREDSIPATSFEVDDVRAFREELVAKGVRIVSEPTETGPAWVLVIDDSVGNLIQFTSPVEVEVEAEAEAEALAEQAGEVAR